MFVVLDKDTIVEEIIPINFVEKQVKNRVLKLADKLPPKKRGEQVGYQARKKAKTINSLYLPDKTRFNVTMPQSISSEHHIRII